VPNGKPYDHPLTEIFVPAIPIYGEEADDLIRRIAGLCSPHELSEWWEREIGWSCGKDSALHNAQLQLTWLSQRDRDNACEAKD
jgi:hypothetical protein